VSETLVLVLLPIVGDVHHAAGHADRDAASVDDHAPAAAQPAHVSIRSHHAQIEGELAPRADGGLDGMTHAPAIGGMHVVQARGERRAALRGGKTEYGVQVVVEGRESGGEIEGPRPDPRGAQRESQSLQ
jgi:hypothetical protein